MAGDHNSNHDLFRGLQALAENAFPKRCPNCGRVYATAEDFLRETVALRGDHSGLKQSLDDDERAIVEVFRNCVCGSTLMDVFNNRRDKSERGHARRGQFDALLHRLERRDIERETARGELRKLLRGEESPLIRGLLAER